MNRGKWRYRGPYTYNKGEDFRTFWRREGPDIVSRGHWRKPGPRRMSMKKLKAALYYIYAMRILADICAAYTQDRLRESSFASLIFSQEKL